MSITQLPRSFSVGLVLLAGACTASDPFDFTCNTIEFGIIDASFANADSQNASNIVRVFDVQEAGRSSGSLSCRGKAEWSNGSTTAIQMEAVDGPQGVQYRYQVPTKIADSSPSIPVGEDDAGIDQGDSGDPMAGDIAIDPSSVTCEALRPEIVRLSEKDRISRGFAILKVYEPTTVSREDDRLTCHGRASWTNGTQTSIEYGFFRDSEGDLILSYRDLSLNEERGGPRG